MLSDQRQYEIAEMILREGKATIQELAKLYSVSAETIRRDLNVLCQDGKIKKVHGGAVAIRGKVLREESYEARQKKNIREKQEIGRRAARLICDNDIIAIDSGTCTEALAREIYHVHNLCIITLSLPLATLLAQKIQAGDFDGRIILLGGTLSADGQSVYGAPAREMLSQYYIDKAFLGATSISADGLMIWNENEGEITRIMMKQSRFCCVLAESEKLGERSFYRVASPDQIDLLITDDTNEMPTDLCKAISAIEIASAREDKHE